MASAFPILLGVAAVGVLLVSAGSSASAASGGAASGAGTPPKDPSKPAPGTFPIPTDEFGKVSTIDGGPPRKGVQSNPDFQWSYIVKAGDTGPSQIATRVFGTDRRYPELVAYNEAVLGHVGDAANPNTSKYNFKRFSPNDVVKYPKSWNAWIDEQGNYKGGPLPFPPAPPRI